MRSSYNLPTVSSALTLVSPKIQLLDSVPSDGKSLISVNSEFMIDFEKQVPWPYYNFIKVHISPDTPVNISWL